MVEEPVIPAINPNALPVTMILEPRTDTFVLQSRITSEPVIPAKTTPVRPDIANPPVAAVFTKPTQSIPMPVPPVMPVPLTATPAQRDIQHQTPE